MKRCVVLLCLAACACGREAASPPPPLGADHQTIVRERYDAVLAARYELEQASDYRFAAPELGRVAAWHWEPQEDGRVHAFGYRHGWCVHFHVRPHYAGYPEQPEQHHMAFFANGKLRGLFGEGVRGAPLELDRWAPDWVDPDWRLPPASAPPK